MNSRAALAALALAASSAVHADYDAKLEAQEAAQRKAAAEAQAQRKAAAQAQRNAAEQKAMRAMLGPQARGMSDAEVKQAYDAKMAESLRAAKAQQGKSQQQLMKEALERSGGGLNANAKGAGGKSMNDIANMSDAEREAFAKQMEKQYGGAAK